MSGTTGVVLGMEGGGESAGEGVLLEDGLVSLLVRLCCKRALICFIADGWVCSHESPAVCGSYKSSECLLDSPWQQHLLRADYRAATAWNPRSQQCQGLYA